MSAIATSRNFKRTYHKLTVMITRKNHARARVRRGLASVRALVSGVWSSVLAVNSMEMISIVIQTRRKRSDPPIILPHPDWRFTPPPH